MNYKLIEISKPTDLNSYCLFKNYSEFKISNYYKIVNSDNCNILLLKSNNNFPVSTSGNAMKTKIEANHIFGSFPLKLSFGNFYLRREKIEDKIANIFDYSDIDFDNHKKFSNKYYLVGDKEDSIRKHFSYELLDYVSNIDNLELKVIKNRYFLCISRLPVSNELENQTIEVCLQLQKLFNY